MSVCQIKGYMRPAAGQQVRGENNSLIKGEGGEEGLHLLGLRTEIGTAAFGGVALFPFYDVMVAVEKVQTVFLIELFEKPEYVAVDIDDIFHASVFPKLIPVAQLNIGKALSVIMLQRGKIQVLVFEKIIGGISYASMAVAHEDIARAVCERQDGSVHKGVIKTREGAHSQAPLP